MSSKVPWFVLLENPADLYSNGSFVALDFEADSEQKGSPLVDSNDLVS